MSNKKNSTERYSSSLIRRGLELASKISIVENGHIASISLVVYKMNE
jgi:hypothetical protein